MERHETVFERIRASLSSRPCPERRQSWCLSWLQCLSRPGASVSSCWCAFWGLEWSVCYLDRSGRQLAEETWLGESFSLFEKLWVSCDCQEVWSVCLPLTRASWVQSLFSWWWCFHDCYVANLLNETQLSLLCSAIGQHVTLTIATQSISFLQIFLSCIP